MLQPFSVQNPRMVLTAGCVDIDPPVGQCMYDWAGKSFNETACVSHAMGVNLTEMRCYMSFWLALSTMIRLY